MNYFLEKQQEVLFPTLTPTSSHLPSLPTPVVLEQVVIAQIIVTDLKAAFAEDH
jgi:hypothetical protein